MSVSGQRTGWGTYKRIAEELTTRVQSGKLPAGSPVPSEAVLGREYGVSRTVVRRALAVLEKEGLVRVVPGSGRVVTSETERGGPVVKGSAPFRVIARDLRRSIVSGELAPGDAVPSESELAARYGVSRMTVRHAFSVLEGAGLVAVVRGKGRTVTQR